MIPWLDIKKELLEELETCEDWSLILDMYYMLLKSYGLSYIRVRSKWMAQAQLTLFSEEMLKRDRLP